MQTKKNTRHPAGLKTETNI